MFWTFPIKEAKEPETIQVMVSRGKPPIIILLNEHNNKMTPNDKSSTHRAVLPQPTSDTFLLSAGGV